MNHCLTININIMKKFEILTGTNIEAARELKAAAEANTKDFNPFWSSAMEFEPVQREFYGRFLLALSLRETLEELAGGSADDVLDALESKIETELYVYGKSVQTEYLRVKAKNEDLQKVSNSNPDPAN